MIHLLLAGGRVHVVRISPRNVFVRGFINLQRLKNRLLGVLDRLCFRIGTAADSRKIRNDSRDYAFIVFGDNDANSGDLFSCHMTLSTVWGSVLLAIIGV